MWPAYSRALDRYNCCRCCTISLQWHVLLLQVAELMLLHGLASIVRHRTDDERSAYYEALLQAEQVHCLHGPDTV